MFECKKKIKSISGVVKSFTVAFGHHYIAMTLNYAYLRTYHLFRTAKFQDKIGQGSESANLRISETTLFVVSLIRVCRIMSESRISEFANQRNHTFLVVSLIRVCPIMSESRISETTCWRRLDYTQTRQSKQAQVKFQHGFADSQFSGFDIFANQRNHQKFPISVLGNLKSSPEGMRHALRGLAAWRASRGSSQCEVRTCSN